jgi:carboxymethylenebutenolidase
MTRLTAKDFNQELLDLYDFYAHGMITKREFLDRAGRYAGGGVGALALFNMLKPDYAMAEPVSFTDPDIKATFETYDSPNGNGTVKGYLVKPAKATRKIPAVLVIHEDRGLNPYIKDVARRVAKAGFMALAPDGLTSVGGYPGNDADGKVLQKTVDQTKLLNDFFAGYEHLIARPDSTGKVRAVGFCYGGGVCNALAAAYPELSASVPFYGRQAKADDVTRIQAPLLLH